MRTIITSKTIQINLNFFLSFYVLVHEVNIIAKMLHNWERKWLRKNLTKLWDPQGCNRYIQYYFKQYNSCQWPKTIDSVWKIAKALRGVEREWAVGELTGEETWEKCRGRKMRWKLPNPHNPPNSSNQTLPKIFLMEFREVKPERV